MKGGYGLEHEVTRALADAKTAEARVRAVCRESKNARVDMIGTVARIAKTVRECGEKLTDEQGNTGRYLMVCRMLESLEEEKRRLDACLASYFHLDGAFTQATIHCLRWQGEWTSETVQSSEIATAGGRIERALFRMGNEKKTYAQSRDALGVLSREIFPRFLGEVYRLSDADQNGKGMRAQSVSVLCGELCNHISTAFQN